MLWTIISSLIIGLASLGVYIYYFLNGQFEDHEDVKYQIFHDNEDEN